MQAIQRLLAVEHFRAAGAKVSESTTVLMEPLRHNQRAVQAVNRIHTVRQICLSFKDGRNILRKGIADIFHIGFGRFFEGEAVDKQDLEEQKKLLKLQTEMVWFICDKNTKYAMVMSKSIRDLKVYEIEGIDMEGYYWSTKEAAEAALKEMSE